jgi:hypothetical protein
MAVAALVATLAGCGTTVPLGADSLRNSTGTAGAGPGLGPVTSTPTVGLPLGAEAAGTGGAPVAGLPGGGPTAAPPTASRGQTPALPRAGAPVEIGVLVVTNTQAFGNMFGVQNDLGDPKAQVEAVVATLNKQGGLLGRRIVPVFYEFDATSTRPYAVEEQAMCSKWTEDHHVFAAISLMSMAKVLPACLNGHGVPLLLDTHGGYGGEDFARWPLLFSTTVLRTQSTYRTLVRRLGAQGFFTKGAKIGLAYVDEPGARAVANQVVRPELARLGLSLTAEFAFPVVHQTSEASASFGAAQNAALRFRSQGITHVLLQDINNTVAGPFFTAAEANGYRPLYGVTSDSDLPTDAQLVPPAQLRGVHGIVWHAWHDQELAKHLDRNNALAKRCVDLLHAAGQKVDSTGIALTYCDFLFFIQAATERGGALTPQAFRKGAEALGTSFLAGSGFGSEFLPGKHDGPAYVRDVLYSEACSCFRFAGAVRTSVS